LAIHGKIFTVFGCKGGVGKTTIALNLAVSLARNKGKKVALVELNNEGGSLAAHLGLEAQPNFLPFLSQIEDFAPEELAKKLLLHKSGIRLLFSPQMPQVAEPAVGGVERLLHLLTYTHDYLVVDCAQNLTASTIAILDLAHCIVLAITGDLAALESTSAMLTTLAREGFPLGKIGIVVNRYSLYSTPKEQIAKLLPVEILGFLPEEPGPLASAVASGIPAVSSSKCGFVRALEEIQNQLLRFSAEHKTPPSRLWPNKSEKYPQINKDQWLAIKQIVQKKLLEDLTDQQLAGERLAGYTANAQLEQKVKRLVAGFDLPREAEFAKSITSHLFGLGPLDRFLEDDSVAEIMVNGPGPVYVEREGKIHCTECAFSDAEEIVRLIQRIASRLGRRIDESSPMVDARLVDGSRVNAVLPPVSLCGPILTIRKFSRQRFAMPQLVEAETLSQQMADFLEFCIRGRRNIIVAGGASSGKTTTLDALSGFIDPAERIITIEDAAELRLQQSHVIALEARPANVEGKGEITIRQLLRNALRMRPDRIIVGEVRGDEVIDMIQALNTGHNGSLSTVHANSPRELLTRLEGMMLIASPSLPLVSVREQLAAAIDLIVYQRRFPDGNRKITTITEVLGMGKEQIQLQDLFEFKDNDFQATGKASRFTSVSTREVRQVREAK
jgi:pilus assembly protein CpaF